MTPERKTQLRRLARLGESSPAIVRAIRAEEALAETLNALDAAEKREAALRHALSWTVERIDEHLDIDGKCWCGQHPNPGHGPCDPCLDRQALAEARAALAQESPALPSSSPAE